MILVGTTWHAFNKSAASNFKCSRLSRRPDPIRSSDIVVLFYQLRTHNTAVVYEWMQCMFDHVTVFLSVNMASVDLESVVSTNLTQQTTCWELVFGFNMWHLYITWNQELHINTQIILSARHVVYFHLIYIHHILCLQQLLHWSTVHWSPLIYIVGSCYKYVVCIFSLPGAIHTNHSRPTSSVSQIMFYCLCSCVKFFQSCKMSIF